MRIATFADDRVGVVEDDTLVDISEVVDALSPPDGHARPLRVIAAWPRVHTALRTELDRRDRIPLGALRLQAPIPRPGKIVAAPLNYVEHNREMAHTGSSMADLGVFLKANSSVIGHGSTVELPYDDRRTDQEGELGVVIGTRARGVRVEDARSHVFGYTCLLDITVRGGEDRSTRKSFDTFTPIGPWITTADEVEDPDDLDLRCWVNDELRQAANTRDLIFGVDEIVAYASSIMTLEPGDLIATGTPAGVGPLAGGDAIAVEITGLGRLQVTVSADASQPWKAGRLRVVDA